MRDEHSFGDDQLSGRVDLIAEREQRFFRRFTANQIFTDCVNQREQTLKDAVIYHLDITNELAMLL